MEIKERLNQLGINPNKNPLEIIEDLINIVQFLYDESEITENERFYKEIKRLQRPTS